MRMYKKKLYRRSCYNSVNFYLPKNFKKRSRKNSVFHNIFLKRLRVLYLYLLFFFKMCYGINLCLFVASSSYSFQKRSQMPKHWSQPINFAYRRWLMENKDTKDWKGSQMYQLRPATWSHETTPSYCEWWNF